MKMKKGTHMAVAILLSLIAGFMLCTPARAELRTMTLGHYEQDGDWENGPEPIEWLILEKSDGKMLLLSKYLLFISPIDSYYGSIPWPQASLREFLNDSFLREAFDEEEQTHLDQYKTSDESEDFVFLPSAGQMYTYLPEEYRKATEAYLPDSDAKAWWLIDKVGRYDYAYVGEDGIASSYGADLTSNLYVRPMIWYSTQPLRDEPIYLQEPMTLE